MHDGLLLSSVFYTLIKSTFLYQYNINVVENVIKL